jgi:radical SAM protein with 4Fe4S-binding SPASM domain
MDREEMAELEGRERTAEEWIAMAKEIQEAGAIGLLLTGGEPLLRPDFPMIYQEIAKLGFMLTLYTNATLITPGLMEVLRKYPPHRIGITVYGASQDTYEKVTGNPEAYDRMLQGVRLLRQLPSKLTIRTTMIRDNIHDLDRITRWAQGIRPQVEFSVSRIVTKPVRGCKSNVEACRLTPEQNVAMLEKRSQEFVLEPFRMLVKEHPQLIENRTYEQHKEVSCNRSDKTLYGCEAGMISYTITWDGKLIGCQMLGDCWTYPFEEGFRKAWEEFPGKVKLPPLPEKCSNCSLSCCACPATRLAETGRLDGVPEYLCKESVLAKEMETKLIAQLNALIKGGDKKRVTV